MKSNINSGIAKQIKNSNPSNSLKENRLIKIFKHKIPIAYGICSIGFLSYGYIPIAILSTIGGLYNFFKESDKLRIKSHNYIDEEFTKKRNNKIIYALDMIKKYVFKHPELSRYFPENKSTFHLTTWAALNQNALGSGYVHDDKLTNKRWEISSEIINEENTSHGVFHSIVLFHTPTHFVIEYLRVDIDSPISKRITIIDGRKDMKEWIDEIPEDKINKRVYSKYRPDDKYKY